MKLPSTLEEVRPYALFWANMDKHHNFLDQTWTWDQLTKEEQEKYTKMALGYMKTIFSLLPSNTVGSADVRWYCPTLRVYLGEHTEVAHIKDGSHYLRIEDEKGNLVSQDVLTDRDWGELKTKYANGGIPDANS